MGLRYVGRVDENHEGVLPAREYMVDSVAGTLRSTTMSNPEHIDFFWRPGCGFCMALERALTTAEIPYTKHNIWENPDHAAFVRSVADGNEVVPTLRIGASSLVNPSLKDVVATMRDEVPHLIPAGL